MGRSISQNNLVCSETDTCFSSFSNSMVKLKLSAGQLLVLENIKLICDQIAVLLNG